MGILFAVFLRRKLLFEQESDDARVFRTILRHFDPRNAGGDGVNGSEVKEGLR